VLVFPEGRRERKNTNSERKDNSVENGKKAGENKNQGRKIQKGKKHTAPGGWQEKEEEKKKGGRVLGGSEGEGERKREETGASAPRAGSKRITRE